MDLLAVLLQPQPAQGGGYQMLIMMGLLLIVFYFFMIRPQQKKAKDARKFRDNLQKGARVVTIGGLHGKVVEVSDKTILIEAAEGVKLRFEKSAIAMDNTMQLNEETARTA
ncbi:MAG: preprotein translocase subunit YajC [Flavobacteriales bacterium]